MTDPARAAAPLDALVQLLVEQGIAAPATIRGCSEDELRALEAHHGRPLPRAYREFLRVMGHEMGELFAESEIRCGPHLLTLRADAEAMLRAGGVQTPLPDSAIVFAGHGPDAFDFFLSGESDDPPVYQYLAGSASWQRIAPSFTGYLKSAVADHLAIVHGWASEEAVAARAAAEPGSSAVFWTLLVLLIALFFAIAIFGDQIGRALFD
ncbi:MAG: SMI1/KNR4 family protein [Chloroflexota bacterium]|nr:SMI1/KNR4 family protein [Anaerolineae bacterium]HMM27598.1 SMI1/KNR4 family protein [Aggregatilineaceae bacterium]HMM27645.1 SMI1/KNR4 family protein [Aggregatilineaceae bacterium]